MFDIITAYCTNGKAGMETRNSGARQLNVKLQCATSIIGTKVNQASK